MSAENATRSILLVPLSCNLMMDSTVLAATFTSANAERMSLHDPGDDLGLG
jgi:hypothetical protein